MTMISSKAKGHSDAIVDALQAEFGAILAARILEAEATDFLWDARVCERYLGQHVDLETEFGDDVIEFSRVAILSSLAGRWHSAVCLIDGEGRAVALLWQQAFDHQDNAGAAYECAT